MTNQNTDQAFIFQSSINSFAYLYQDAEYFHHVAQRPEIGSGFECVQLCRTALLLYILSLEGLINRALDNFLPEHLHDFILEREDKFRLEDKWLLLPLLAAERPGEQFDESSYPWSHFVELVSIRNDFVHPKHRRPAYYRAIRSHDWEPLSWKEIPRDLGVKETELIYRQTRIPKDPYAIRPEHVDIVKKVVDDIIAKLDGLLGGKLNRENWLSRDQMTLIYPPGAKLNDLASSKRSPQQKGMG